MRGTTQKLKLLYLKEIFEEETDNEHAISMPKIVEELKNTVFLQKERAFMMIYVCFRKNMAFPFTMQMAVVPTRWRHMILSSPS